MFGLSVVTTLLAVKYLDRFLGSNRFDVRPVQGWLFHLVANACQTLAIKFHESLQLDSDLTQKHVDIAFDRVCVRKMESLVLRELGWNLNDVVPYAYIPGLLNLLRFQGEDCARILGRSEVYLLSILYDADFVRWPPSVVACAIVSVLLEDEGLNMDGVISQLCSMLPEIDRAHVQTCAMHIDAFRSALSSTQSHESTPLPACGMT